MAGIRHIVNYICRGRRKSFFLLLATIGVVCFLFGRISQGGGLFGLIIGGNGSVQARDLSVQNIAAGPERHVQPGVAPVFPDPIKQDVRQDVQIETMNHNKSSLPTVKHTGYVSGKSVYIS